MSLVWNRVDVTAPAHERSQCCDKCHAFPRLLPFLPCMSSSVPTTFCSSWVLDDLQSPKPQQKKSQAELLRRITGAKTRTRPLKSLSNLITITGNWLGQRDPGEA